MAAELSSTGTWTTLRTDLTKLEDTKGNLPGPVDIAPEDLEAIPDELRQFIALAGAGFGAQLGANRRLGYWPTVIMVEKMLKQHREKGGVPRAGDNV